MTTVNINKLHARNIRIAVAYVDHISKRNPVFIRFKKGIYTLVVYVQNTLLNSEKELGLVGIIYDLGRPYRHSVFIIIKRTGVNLFKLVCNLRSLYHLFKSRRNYIMFYNHAFFHAIFINPVKP